MTTAVMDWNMAGQRARQIGWRRPGAAGNQDVSRRVQEPAKVGSGGVRRGVRGQEGREVGVGVEEGNGGEKSKKVKFSPEMGSKSCLLCTYIRLIGKWCVCVLVVQANAPRSEIAVKVSVVLPESCHLLKKELRNCRGVGGWVGW